MDVVISLGGSLIAPDHIDTDFLKSFEKLIVKHVNNGTRFVIICGGGKTARRYQEAASDVIDLLRDDLDWLGIHSTRLNAHLLRTIFRKHAHPNIVKNPKRDVKVRDNILIASGWKPGFSTDYDAVLLAKKFNIKKVFNLSNIDYVCDKDPNKHEGCVPIKQISWKDFRKLVGDEWHPGLNAPFDPVAAKLAEKLGLEVIIMNGKDMENLDKALNKKKFRGTVIK
ncbi:MAG: UMP kinase [Candidatus Aenigmatarchaeota archaeon]|nr:UMP kinase [Nanoarchaeota archaeon]